MTRKHPSLGKSVKIWNKRYFNYFTRTITEIYIRLYHIIIPFSTYQLQSYSIHPRIGILLNGLFDPSSKPSPCRRSYNQLEDTDRFHGYHPISDAGLIISLYHIFGDQNIDRLSVNTFSLFLHRPIRCRRRRALS